MPSDAQSPAAARPDPRGRLRGTRRGTGAEGRRRRRRAGRQARLPHLPAAPLPGRHRPARNRSGRTSLARPFSQGAERHRSPGNRHGDRPGQARGAVRRDGTAHLRLPRAGARCGGQLLRSRGRSRARLPDVHARRRGAPQEARPGQVGSRRPGRESPGRWDRQRGGRRRRADRGGERGRARRALPEQLRGGLPEPAAGEGADHPRRGCAGALHDVQAEAPGTTPRRRSRSAASRFWSASSSAPSSRRGSR